MNCPAFIVIARYFNVTNPIAQFDSAQMDPAPRYLKA
jgi:hypothetical protein